MRGQQTRILTLQQRMREIGRIRLGEKSDKGNPKKLTTLRFTSRDKFAIDRAAQIYGGKVKQCDGVMSPDLKGQWEVVTNTSDVPFFPSPTPPSQALELWSGGGCQRRCDGCTESISGDACLCDPEAPDCKPTTRLSVILPDLPDIGVWRLESHGWNTAAELLQTYDWLTSMCSAGRVIEARLAVEERTGKADGKTTRFMVPVIRIPHTPRELMQGVGSVALEPAKQQAPELPKGTAQALPPRAVHETPDHIFKEPNPRGGAFAILSEMKLPAHEGRAKNLYYAVFGQVLKMPVTSLSELTEEQWRTVHQWLYRVNTGEAKMPKAFTDWLAGTHHLQRHDPMAAEESQAESAPNNPVTTQPTLTDAPAPMNWELTSSEAKAFVKECKDRGYDPEHEKQMAWQEGHRTYEKLMDHVADPFVEGHEKAAVPA